MAALQFGSKRIPEPRDKFVILQVPCYTEGEESLLKTINSLATLKYDDKRKLLVLICDGQLVGAGNEKTTPAIALDILGASTTDNIDPLIFRSIGEGSRQINYGKVYSGLYEYEGHVLPYVVIVSCDTLYASSLDMYRKGESWETFGTKQAWQPWQKGFANTFDAVLKSGAL